MEPTETHIVGRLLLSSALVGYAVVTLRADLGETHATNPRWLRHARFHVVWQSLTNAAIILLGLVLIWWPGPMLRPRLYLAGAFGAIILGTFFVTTLTRSLFGGGLRDAEGEPPLRLDLGPATTTFDANVVIFTILSIILLAGVVTITL
ncbi:hypothetical protein [Microvirga brassicacearum]|uniref:Uncharacterized protein n=1 Tax=Microvirga brassicacearum TaxID=2580413 RepID=A0A5N3P6S8_9HYPH|nr:hypothetical protein [Microvirga brassicacearum]KAB0265429.1 hypothetical protein FEZ63_18280 [Microvirga brassicacearum]